jgi:hypothetical protein
MSDPPAERLALRRQWLAAVAGEIERREREALDAVSRDPMRSLLLIFDGMAERLKTAPDYHPPARREAERNSRTVERWLHRAGYMRPD